MHPAPPVNKYSGDVMIPAFLNAYTSMGGGSLSIFPTLADEMMSLSPPTALQRYNKKHCVLQGCRW